VALAAAGARHALVLSGGGANGAYEVGVVRALAEGASPATGFAPLAARIYSGTSVGAFNAAFLAQDWSSGRQAAGALDEVWRRQVADSVGSCGNGVYRLRGDPLRWVDPGCAVHPLNNLLVTAGDAAHFAVFGLVRGLNFLTAAEPLRVRLSDLVDISAFISESPFQALLKATIDLGGLARSPSELRVVATDWLAGKAVVFDKTDVVSRFGTDAIEASGAIPGIFPPVLLDGKPFVDGSLRMNSPLQPAIAAGADVLHVVYLDPDVVEVPLPNLPNTLDTFYRVYVILIATNVNRDVFTAALVNEDRELVGRLGMEATDPRLAGLTFLQAILRRRRTGRPYRPLVIHRYRPKLPLGNIAGLLDFRANRIDELIALGYDDAVHHDCGAEQCILPPAPAGPPGNVTAIIS
jgi:predicted acylesterase/phospholipase RssA